MTTLPPATRPTRLLTLVLVVVLALVVAACGGSKVPPKVAVGADARVQGLVANGGATPGTTVPGADTGTSAGTGTTTPGASGTGGGTVDVGPGGSTSSSEGPGGSPGGRAGGSAVPGTNPGSCTGFKNQTGITDQTITIGNGADISGPVPGLFTAAQQATQAYAAYFNSRTTLCGRKLKVITYDTRVDAAADQQASLRFCESAFAAVGGMATFDSGGAAAAQHCGLPDMRAIAVTAVRAHCTTCYAAEATGDHEFSNSVPDFFVTNHHAASQKAAFLYLNVGSAVENAKTQQAVEEKRGMHFLYTQAIDVADFNYGPYVQQLKSRGVRWVQFIGAYQQQVRFAQAMQQASYKPDVYLLDPSAYDVNFIKTGGSAVEGTYIYTLFIPFEERQPEFLLYNQWLQQVAPGAKPTFFGMFAWSATKLFVRESVALGGRLTRAALVARLHNVATWTADGLHGPMLVGSKHAPSCVRFLQVRGGRYVPVGGKAFLCHGHTQLK